MSNAPQPLSEAAFFWCASLESSTSKMSSLGGPLLFATRRVPACPGFFCHRVETVAIRRGFSLLSPHTWAAGAGNPTATSPAVPPSSPPQLAVGAPLKMASLLAHLSGFTQSAIVVFPSVEERVKYSFALRPADLVALPALGDSLPLYAKSVC